MSSYAGLTSVEAKVRLEQFGPNLIQVTGQDTTLRLLLSQFTDPVMLLLLGATLLAMLLGEVFESLIILAIVIPTALLSFYQEHRAGRELGTLLERVKLTANVFRDGKPIEVGVDQLVPGDLVELRLGTQIPADLQIMVSIQLLIDESVLTCESFPVEKRLGEIIFLGT
ncbi:MAG: cation-transporting P-type ATPase, partial [Aquiluna sp.]